MLHTLQYLRKIQTNCTHCHFLDQSEGCIAPGLTNQRRRVGETFHLSQLQTVFCGFSIFSVLKQINVDRNMKNILSPRQIRCISMCSSLFLKKNKTQDEIEEELKLVCNYFPTKLNAEVSQ